MPIPSLSPTFWVGIDEAGYGPNLGPLVMSAVMAVSETGDRPPDVWADLAPAVARAGGDPRALWLDDSKALYRPGQAQGRDRLETACLAVVAATRPAGDAPATLTALLDAVGVGAGTFADLGLVPRPAADGPEPDPALPTSATARPLLATALAARPFARGAWRLAAVRSVVVGPGAFNARLDALGGNKARVHFEAFARLLTAAWSLAPAGAVVRVCGDKHGGRHFYQGPLVAAFPDAWVDRGEEGPARSCYVVRDGTRRLELTLMPRADAADGLVALASVVSKTLREYAMDRVNASWARHVAGLRPTAGYPVDAARFRRAIEPTAAALGLHPDSWWRRK